MYQVKSKAAKPNNSRPSGDRSAAAGCLQDSQPLTSPIPTSREMHNVLCPGSAFSAGGHQRFLFILWRFSDTSYLTCPFWYRTCATWLHHLTPLIPRPSMSWLIGLFWLFCPGLALRGSGRCLNGSRWAWKSISFSEVYKVQSLRWKINREIQLNLFPTFPSRL